MKVLDLQCEQGHSFEGWFASENDFSAQKAGGLLTCPMCGDAQIHKLLSAPRLNLSGAQAPSESAPSETPQAATPSHNLPAPLALQARFLQAVREVMANTEDVGERFADQARAMHHGDIEQRSIRGQTTPDVAMELMEEGIAVMPLPMLPALKETLQ